MEKKKNTQIMVIAILSIALLFMSAGFAGLATTLNINGTATVKANTWSVHYVTTGTGSYAETTGSVAASAHNVTNTDFTFTVTLNKPGDFYEATVDVINAGTLNAELTSVTMTALGNPQQKYLSYKVYYDGHEFTSSQTGLSYSLPATTGNTKTVKVRAEYIAPENSSDLPGTDDPVTLTASLGFEQAAS